MAQLPAYNPVRSIQNLIREITSISKAHLINHIKSVPYLGRIPGGLRPTQMIRIRGIINSIVRDNIVINVQSGAAITPLGDCNLHLSIRLNENIIVRNDRQRGAWGIEERFGGCPLERGQNFEILILAEHQRFKIALNGVHYCEFNYRMSLEKAVFVFVKGEVSIQSITIEGDTPSAPPMPMPAIGAHATISSTPSFPTVQPAPYQPSLHHNVIHQHPNYQSPMPQYPQHLPYPQQHTPTPYPRQVNQTITSSNSQPGYPIYMNRTEY